MKSTEADMNTHKSLDKLECALENLHLNILNLEEERLVRLKVDCYRQRDWAQLCLCLKKLVDVRSQKQSLKRKFELRQEKLRFQQQLQEQHGDSKMVIVHEFNLDVDPVRIKFEIISKHVDTHSTPLFSSFNNQEPSIVETKGDEIASKQEELDLYSSVVPIYDEYPDSCNEEGSEEIVEASCVEVINDLKGDVEASCVEVVDDLEEIVETTNVEDVDSLMQPLEVVNYPSSWRTSLHVVQATEGKFVHIDRVVKQTHFVEFVHVSRFVEVHPTKIRGRIFSKKGRMQQAECSLGNTSKLIFLVSLFNIWVWFIMQVRATAFFLTCVMVMGNLIPNLIKVC